MKQSLSLRMGQTLAMTPALQQAIRLLQLSSLDLQAEVQTALEENLMLERVEDGEEAEPLPDEADDLERESAVETLAADDPFLPEEWRDSDGARHDERDEDADYAFRQASLHAREGLHEHLAWQAHLSFSEPLDAELAAHIIDAIDDDGYLADWPDLSARLAALPGADAARVDAVLRWVQALDPVGVAARDLRECLRLQLETSTAPTAERQLALRIVAEHLPLVAEGRLSRIAQLYATDEQAVADAVALIRGLSPHPGRAYAAQPADYVVPDVIVRRRDGRWQVALNPDIAPRIRINAQYAALMRQVTDAPGQQMLRQHLQDARHLIGALKSRNDTLLKVATRIVEEQLGFLEHGPEAMRPLVLRDIAGHLGIHESTVSRATANKYMQTPRGLYELKFFFSSSIRTTQGGHASATAIQAMLQRLIAAEPTGRPHSDAKLADLLHEEGFEVARRTIAKYRESIGVPPAHQRRRQA